LVTFDLPTTPLAFPLNDVSATHGLLGMPPHRSRTRRGSSRNRG
jgi:hypothetical protein